MPHRFVLAGLAVLALAAPVQAETVWDMHINFPAGNFDTQNAMTFAEAVEEATGGEVVINVKAGGSLGLKGPEVLGAVRDGIVPIAHFHLDTAVGEAPFMGIQGLPYLTQGFDDAQKLHALAEPVYARIAAENNQKILYTTFWPGAHLYTKGPVATVDDLAGLKIRTANKSSTDFFEALGAAPVLMPWADALVALAAGGLDGIATSATSGVDGKFWEFQSTVTPISYLNPAAVVTVNLDAFDALSPEHRAAIERVAAELEPQLRAVAEEEDEKRLAELAAQGMTVTEPDPAFEAALADAARSQWDDFAANVGPDAERVLGAYREEVGR
jgi:TRAP-type C4-dicarboxylate transport system substrate-binding protein